MPSITATQTPITGREALGALQEPVQALAQFYRAFNSADLALMAENWDNSDDVAMDNPLGGIARGWPAIRSIYERIFSGPARITVEFHDYTLHRCGDVFFAMGRERGERRSASASLALAVRTTRVFRLIEGRWRQVHHHGSIDDPQLLAEYQGASAGIAKLMQERGIAGVKDDCEARVAAVQARYDALLEMMFAHE